MALEDYLCLQNEETVYQEDCVLARTVQGTEVHFREELWMPAGKRKVDHAPVWSVGCVRAAAPSDSLILGAVYKYPY